jgi:hypothetical protein
MAICGPGGVEDYNSDTSFQSLAFAVLRLLLQDFMMRFLNLITSGLWATVVSATLQIVPGATWTAVSSIISHTTC